MKLLKQDSNLQIQPLLFSVNHISINDLFTFKFEITVTRPRTFLGSFLRRWDSMLLKGVLANYRKTGVL